MNTNIRIKRICDFCLKDFTAKTTKTRYCSHKCDSKGYKALARNEKVEVSLDAAHLHYLFNITIAQGKPSLKFTAWRIIDFGSQ